MARTNLSLADVRVPTKRERAERILERFNDLDDLLDSLVVNAYSAAGAIATDSDVVELTADSVGMAMTLADGAATVPLKMTIKLVAIDATGDTVVLTPATLDTYTTITFDAVGEKVSLYWNGSSWFVNGTPTATAA